MSSKLLKLGRGLISHKGKPTASTMSPEVTPFGSMTNDDEGKASSARPSGAVGRPSGKSSVGGPVKPGSPFERLRTTVEGAGGSGSSGKHSEPTTSSGGGAGNLWGVDGGPVLQREPSMASKLNLPPSLRMARSGAGPPGAGSGTSVSSVSSVGGGGPSGISNRGGPSSSRGGGTEGSGTSFSPLRGKGAPNNRSWESTLQVLTAVTLTTTDGAAGESVERGSIGGGMGAAGPSSGNRPQAADLLNKGPERSRLSQATMFKVVGGELDDGFLQKSRTASEFDLAARQSSCNRQHSTMHKSIFSKGKGIAGRSPPAQRTTMASDPRIGGPTPSALGHPTVQVQLAEAGEEQEEEDEEEDVGAPAEGGYQWSEDSYMVVDTGGAGSSFSSSVGAEEALAARLIARAELSSQTQRDASSTVVSEGLGLLSTVNGLMQDANLARGDSAGPRSLSRGLNGVAGPIAEGIEGMGDGATMTSRERPGPVAEGTRRGRLQLAAGAVEGTAGSGGSTTRTMASPRSDRVPSFISR